MESLARTPIAGIELVEPPPLVLDHVAVVHDPAYLRALEFGEPRALAESQGFRWDRGLWPMVLASNGGAVAAALAALQEGVAGSLSSGLHHARRGIGAGFCSLNGLVIAAHAALAAGATSVLIVDLDAHCGGGTASLIANDPRIWQVDVAVCEFDTYPATDRSRLIHVDQSSDYLPAVRSVLHAAERTGIPFDLCLYNAGMDPHEDCPTGGLREITSAVLAERERILFEWCAERSLPTAFVLAGGYVGPRLDREGLVELHRLTLMAAVDRVAHDRSRREPTN